MSTRSAIAYPHGDGWRGRYVHSDGYPTVRGAEVFAFLNGRTFDDYRELIDVHNAGLSWMPKPDEDPHDTNRPWGKPLIQSGPGGDKFGNGSCYASWGRDEKDKPVDQATYIEEQGRCGESCDPLFIEWAYVASENGALTIYAARKASDPSTTDDPNGYEHVVVWSGRWDGDEPDWAAIESGANTEEEASL